MSSIETRIYETYGQCGEDLIVVSLLRGMLCRANRGMDSVRYIEIGANHPIQTNNTYLLYRKYGACGVLVEANPALAENLTRIRPRDQILMVAVSNGDAASVGFSSEGSLLHIFGAVHSLDDARVINSLKELEPGI